MKKVLTIAGSDSGGGAGIQADLKTITLLGAFGMSALTALTAQNTVAVEAIHDVPPDFIAAQIDAVFSDIGVDAVKTGMLSNARVVQLVAEKIAEHRPSIVVVDPVMVAKSGAHLLAADARQTLTKSLLPLATVVTPNLEEASALVGWKVGSEKEMRRAAEQIHGLGPANVLIKGGHLHGDAVDLLF
ncbi:MAG: bifunctional hydroxymethylpyrimidine kinase/phosphomethylpyrimidine kinase, partial [Deltaproteobacteria bacterium]